MAMDHCFFVVGCIGGGQIRPENQAAPPGVEKLGFAMRGCGAGYLHIDGLRDHLCYEMTVEDVSGGLMPRWRNEL